MSKYGIGYYTLRHKSAFAKASVCALVIGIGDLIATGADIVWLIGDITRDAAPYHYFVGGGLIVAFLTMGLSFLWLFHALSIYAKKQEQSRKKKSEKKRLLTQSVAEGE